MAFRILMVEDDAEQAALYANVLRAAGYDVVVAENAATAVGRLTEDTFDLALVDWDLPEMCGDDLIRKIRLEYPDIKTVLFSNHNEVDVLAASSGADAWLRKTEGILRLRQVIAEVLQPT
jgi:CheY-like chemotaxis protein